MTAKATSNSPICSICSTRKGTQGNRIFYLATPPTTYSEIIHQLGGTGPAPPQHTNGNEESWKRHLLTKPFSPPPPSSPKPNPKLAPPIRAHQVSPLPPSLAKETVDKP